MIKTLTLSAVCVAMVVTAAWAEPVKKQLPESFVDPTIGLKFVLVKGKCFDRADADALEERGEPKRVCLGDYYLAETETTQAQWLTLLAKNPSRYDKGGDYPVENVSLPEIKTFIDVLNRQSKSRYRLPTGAEWEFACREGGRAQLYCSGDQPLAAAKSAADAELPYLAVKSAGANRLGFYDLGGNLAEFIAESDDNDWWAMGQSTLGYVNAEEDRPLSFIYSGNRRVELDFSLLAQNAVIEYYPGSGRKEFSAEMTVQENGKALARKRVGYWYGNDEESSLQKYELLVHQGYVFTFSSFNTLSTVYNFSVKNRQTGVDRKVSGRENTKLLLPGGGILQPSAYSQDYNGYGPAAQVSVSVGEQTGQPFVVLQHYPDFDEKRKGNYIVTLLGADTEYSIGLSVIDKRVQRASPSSRIPCNRTEMTGFRLAMSAQ